MMRQTFVVYGLWAVAIWGGVLLGWVLGWTFLRQGLIGRRGLRTSLHTPPSVHVTAFSAFDSAIVEYASESWLVLKFKLTTSYSTAFPSLFYSLECPGLFPQAVAIFHGAGRLSYLVKPLLGLGAWTSVLLKGRKVKLGAEGRLLSV